jgi:hypothetical protein
VALGGAVYKAKQQPLEAIRKRKGLPPLGPGQKNIEEKTQIQEQPNVVNSFTKKEVASPKKKEELYAYPPKEINTTTIQAGLVR